MTEFNKKELLNLLFDEYKNEKNQKKKLKIYKEIIKLQDELRSKSKSGNSEKLDTSIFSATSVTIETEDGTKTRYEEIRNPKTATCQYVTWDNNAKSYAYVFTIDDPLKKRTYIPPCEEDSGVSEDVILFPSEPEDYKSFDYLYNEIDKFVQKYLDIPSDRRKLANYLVILSYFIDRIHTMPVLRFIGLSGNGKTRAVETYGHIAYLPALIASPNAANIYRILSSYNRCTIVVNEDTNLSDKKVFKNEDKEKLRDIYLNGWEDKFVIPRHNNVSNKDEYFKPFGFRVLSSYDLTTNSAYESRCLNIEVSETERNNIIINTDAQFKREALRIRNLLLDFKLKNAHVDFSKYDSMTFEDFKSDKITSKRVCQALAPLMRLELFDNTVRSFIMSLAEQRNTEEIERNANSIEGILLKTYLDLVIEKSSFDITTNEVKEKAGKFFDEWRIAKINNTFKKLGFIVTKSKDIKNRKYPIDKDIDRILKLLKKYIHSEDRIELETSLTEIANKKTIEDYEQTEDSPEQRKIAEEYESKHDGE